MGQGDPEARAEDFSRGSNLGWVADILTARRDEVLHRWLKATVGQPFHEGRLVHAVANHIPHLFDAVVNVLREYDHPAINAPAPLDDPQVLAAAERHSCDRLAQGLDATDVVTEFRLLRQEIGRVLRLHLAPDAPVRDVVGAELLVNDALDGAIALALTALTRHVAEVRQEFLAITVHDVRQPMTALKGNLQIASHATRRLPPSQHDVQGIVVALQRAGQAVDRMEELLVYLSDTARLALGPAELHRGATDLADVVRRSLARLTTGVAGRFIVDVPPGVDTTGEWDASALARVVDNLLSNAVKYSPAGGVIAITMRAAGAAGDGAAPGAVHLSVVDQGVGLTQEELDGLFQRYGRAPSAERRRIEGQGLGLYLSHGIVRAHGGRMWAESPGPGQGTTMHVLLPRRAPASVLPAAHVSQGIAGGR